LDFAVIAGDRPLGAGRMITTLAGAHDGTVAVAETRVPGMREHIVVPASHSQLLLSSTTVRQICAYLIDGHFDRADS
jgi:hypothetical protein